MKTNRDIIWKGLAATAVVAGGMVAIGCTSSLTGNEGELQFSYRTDDLGTDFNKPVAVGAKLDLTVRTAGEQQSVDINDVFVNEDVFLVDGFMGDEFTLEAIGEGTSLVEVDADGPDGATADSVNMRTAVPEVLNLRHTCTSDNRAAYVIERENVAVSFDMKLDDGTDVIGYGYYPVDVPTELGTLDEDSSTQAFMILNLGSIAGDYAIGSTIDEGTLELSVIEESDITEAETNSGADGIRVVEGETGSVVVWPAVEGTRVCHSAPHTATSLTPETCTVRGEQDPDDPESPFNTGSFVSIEGVAAGECRFEVTYTGGNDGTGATSEFVAQIGTFPGEDG